jgi:hypothetical protein
MKCETIGVVIPGATGRTVECISFKGKNLWVYKK